MANRSLKASEVGRMVSHRVGPVGLDDAFSLGWPSQMPCHCWNTGAHFSLEQKVGVCEGGGAMPSDAGE